MATASADNYLERAGGRWWPWALVGLVAVAAGVLAIAYQNLTLTVLGIVFGVWLLSFGAWIIVAAFDPRIHTALCVLRVVVGVVAILAGLTALVRPGTSVLVLLLAVAFWFIIAGIGALVEGIAHSKGRIVQIVLGLLGLAIGALLLQNPDMGLDALSLVAGIGLIVWGVVMMGTGVDVRRLRSA